jgi:16S rRNA (cytidine1402-2'-O)-methyltransferase
MKTGKLYLLPNMISEGNWTDSIPQGTQLQVMHIRHFIVEDLRTARRYLRKIGFETDFNEVQFQLLNKHQPEKFLNEYIAPLLNGFDMAIMSESGLPCIADPGNLVVNLAHEKQIRVIPLVGPSSIFMALMSSGFNGQNFAFVGYLPIENHEKNKALKNLERKIVTENQTQIFIETPYRNQKLFESLLNFPNSTLKLCIAKDINGPSEWIKTMYLADWKSQKIELGKQNCIFLLYK